MNHHGAVFFVIAACIFKFKTLGSFADLGRHRAVANLMGIRVKGFIAWAILALARSFSGATVAAAG